MNFGEMVSIIADDLVEERLTNIQIQNAINAALRFYSRKTFYFNTVKDSMNVVANQEYYPVTNADFYVADLYTIQIIKFIPTGEVDGWPLIVKSDAGLEAARKDQGQRKPQWYAYAQMQIRLFPAPVSAGQLSIIATYMYPKLSGDDDTNPFMERAEELIRQSAKRYLAYNTLHDAGLGDRCAAMEAEEFASLRAETMARDPVEPMIVDGGLVSMSYSNTSYDVVTDQ